MLRFFALRWVSVGLLLSLAACSGGGTSQGTDAGDSPGDHDGGGGGAAGEDLVPVYDAGYFHDAGASDGGDRDGSTDVCTPKTECEADDCGELSSDGCGGTINCKRACEDGKICGLKRPDKCDAPDPESCEPKPAAEVCAGKCGAVSDGCSGTINCTGDNGGVTCAGGQLCGGYDGNRQDNKCVDIPVPPCTKTTCETAGAKCGTISDGCGGVLDCTVEAGGCTGGNVCYFGAETADKKPNTCVAPEVTCQPDLPTLICSGKCGTVIDNCGNPVNCEAAGNGGTVCGQGQSCGAGGANVCGDSTQSCTKTPVLTACMGKCGSVSDGCSGLYNCDVNGGAVCDANQGYTCGGGGTANVCGRAACTPSRTKAMYCGADVCAKGVSDGCYTTFDCDDCSGGKQCGIKRADMCDMPEAPTCTPLSSTILCANKCGEVADGCGGVYHCAQGNGGVTCGNGEWCGGGGVANTCGKPTCTPRACGGNTCGLISNGCGGVVNCWPNANNECPNENEACTSQNGVLQCVSGSPTCTGSLCSNLPTGCATPTSTKLRGTVKTPGINDNGTLRNQLPVPNAIVYIPANPATALPTIFEGVDASNPLSCGRCADEKLVADGQSILAAAVTDYKGEFTLEGRIPVNTAFNLVVKVGKWRRVISVPSGNAVACQSQPLGEQYTRLPAHKTDGGSGTHLPKIAISTGKVDEMECVFRSMGFADSEFTLPSANGRIHMYRANGAVMPGATCSGTYTRSTSCSGMGKTACQAQSGCSWSNFWDSCSGNYDATTQCSADNDAGCKSNRSGCSYSNADSNLFGTYSTLDNYDVVVWDCEGGEAFEAASARTNVENYVNAGGRMFASHYSYTWIENRGGSGGDAYTGTLAQSADWRSGGTADSATGYISMTSGATQRPGANGVKSVLFKNWLDWQGALSGTTAGAPLENPAVPQFTITDPRDRAGANVGIHTDEWVYRAARDHCSNDTSRECDNDSDCRVCSNNTALFCDENSDCGRFCSNDHSRACTRNNQCSGSGQCNYYPGTCGGGGTCTGARVQQLSFNTPYGNPEDEICGRVAYSGFHVANASDNSGSSFPGICGTGNLSAQEKILAFMLFDLATCVSAGDPPAPPACTAKTAAEVCPTENSACGYVSDGCGGVVDCGGCSAGYFCSGNTCTEQQCVPTTCASLGYNCGQHSDGCGGFARDSQGNPSCGTCVGNQVCGLGGPGLCGSVSCTPIPSMTACAGKNCGQVSNGCGGTYTCGTCTAGTICGGGGPNVCGAGSCTVIPKETACANRDCGQVSDGCGGSYDCGSCTAPLTCGGGGVANKCGMSSCVPTPKDQACSGIGCGYVSNGCSGVWDCGSCAAGAICGGAGPNQCGATCEKTSCGAEGAECGAIADDCGGILQCGTCPAGKICGAQTPNKCGTGVSCTPRTCGSVAAECGTIGDGCGGVLDCGACTAPQTCGGAGMPNKCGTGTGGCNKLSCAAQNVACGPTSDGCGGVLDCGGCSAGYECKANKCELLPPVLE